MILIKPTKEYFNQLLELKVTIEEFINPTKAKIELSAMAAVMCNGKIL